MSCLRPRLSAFFAPWPRLLRLLPPALLAIAALAGCRKEVAPPPPPNEVPKPKTQLQAQTQVASRYALSTEGVRLGR